jgi:citrate lyase subunit beta/citryl-CoA lyase
MNPPLDITHSPPRRAPCEHIAGNEKFALKTLQIQEQHLRADGSSLVDITLDLEDGAPIGQEEALRTTFIKIIRSEHNKRNQIGVRVHASNSPHFERDIEAIVSSTADRVAYITLPKVTSLREIRWAAGIISHYAQKSGVARRIPLHLLIETPEALSVVNQLAAHPDVETLDFGLMDFISHLGGAIPSTGMKSPAQFDHPLLSKVKSEIALAALSHNKIPNHNVTVDVRNPDQAFHDAWRARHELGFLRMWSIHPEQIPHIIRGMTPTADEIKEAQEILAAAQAAQWGPIQLNGRLHDRASYRYYWGILTQSGNSLQP